MNNFKTNMRLTALMAALMTTSCVSANNETETSSWSDAIVNPIKDLRDTIAKHFAQATTPSNETTQTVAVSKNVKVAATASGLTQQGLNEPKMTVDDLTTISPDEIRATSTEEIKKWNSAIFFKMNANQTKALSVKIIQALNEDQIQALQAKYLTDDQITALPAQFLLPSQAKALLPHLSSEQISKLTSAAFGALPIDKLDKVLSRFNVKQLEAIEKKFKETNSHYLEKIQHAISLKGN